METNHPDSCHLAPYVNPSHSSPTLPPQAPWYIMGYTSNYYLLSQFTPLLGRFRWLGHLLNISTIGMPVGSTLVALGEWGEPISVIGRRVLGLNTVICEDMISIVAQEHIGRGINNYFGCKVTPPP
ncbi:hypothetical protein DSO57_1012358 [Entomophthora muscae]|uniref:Uncharacterized protein n=1 Tax=Entomophthora muscae TaxID=34485 RepID=A0ACC2TGN1_9FUNG|nr:hypothetical protein DSO57_1012358 [Entomophthora muscae]